MKFIFHNVQSVMYIGQLARFCPVTITILVEDSVEVLMNRYNPCTEIIADVSGFKFLCAAFLLHRLCIL